MEDGQRIHDIKCELIMLYFFTLNHAGENLYCKVTLLSSHPLCFPL